LFIAHPRELGNPFSNQPQEIDLVDIENSSFEGYAI
jgi:hypothetical protein